jgi:energy-coupling factor transport system substrate-specific component
MSKSKLTTSVLTQIAIAVAAIIVGGYAIYIVSSQVPLPGVKYTAMSPYLSLIIAILLISFDIKNIILIVNAVFAMLMSIISPYMGLAILSTGILTQLVDYLVPSGLKYRVHIVAASYSSFVAGTALTVSKLFIDSVVFERINGPYLLVLMGIAFVLGLFGAHFGIVIGKRVRKQN